jgi:hypothetical protein
LLFPIKSNIDDIKFAELARRCQYAYKDDEKKMADNASSIISAMAHGVMVMTQIAYVTPNEFRPDKGDIQSPVITPSEKDQPADAHFVINELEARKKDPEKDKATLGAMKAALKDRYSIDQVGISHLKVYDSLKPKDKKDE